MPENDPPADARFIWPANVAADARNVYARFRRDVTLDAVPDDATLAIFADTRYRLWVNGNLVGHGPARFFPIAPKFDSWQIAKHLRPGRNVIAVLVNNYGTQSFHSQLHRGGLIAWLTGAGETMVATDGHWLASRDESFEGKAVRLSFALNPAEWVERPGEEAWWQPENHVDWPAAVALAAGEWGPLAPRPIAMLDEREVTLGGPVARFLVRPKFEEQVRSVMVQSKRAFDNQNWFAAAIWFTLNAAADETVTLATSLERVFLPDGNEVEATVAADVPAHHRREFTLRLAAGTTRLLGWLPLPGDVNDLVLALPTAAGVTLPKAVEVAGPWRTRELAGDLVPRLPGSLTEFPDVEATTRVELIDGFLAPARQRAWSDVRPIGDGKMPCDRDGLALLYDFGGQYLGRPLLEFDAGPGTTIDLAYTERRDDVGAAYLHERSMVDMMDRARVDGQGTWHVFHPRGGRFIEVLIRGPLKAFQVRKLSVTQALYPVPRTTSFACSDPLLTKLWHLGREALIACSEDAYLDCPWRERGAYVGDALVTWDVDRVCHHDPRLMRRSVELFLEGQGETGLIRPGAHSVAPGRHPDYTLLLATCGRRYVEDTGDVTLATQHVDRWLRLGDGMRGLKDRSGLIDGSGLEPYIDIAQHRNREPRSMVMNAFFVMGMRDLAVLLDAAGRGAEAATCRAEAEQHAVVVQQTYWNEAAGVFDDLPEGSSPSVHGNTLALLTDLVNDAQLAAVRPWLLGQLRDNFLGLDHAPVRDGVRTNAYFSHYVLQALAKLGEHQAAIDFIRHAFGPMVRDGAWTTWESLGGDANGSLCHVWAAAPTWFLTTQVLGVRLADLPRGEVVHVAPKLGDLTHAAGEVPHARGMLKVTARREGDEVRVEADAPDGVELVLP